MLQHGNLSSQAGCNIGKFQFLYLLKHWHIAPSGTYVRIYDHFHGVSCCCNDRVSLEAFLHGQSCILTHSAWLGSAFWISISAALLLRQGRANKGFFHHYPLPYRVCKQNNDRFKWSYFYGQLETTKLLPPFLVLKPVFLPCAIWSSPLHSFLLPAFLEFPLHGSIRRRAQMTVRLCKKVKKEGQEVALKPRQTFCGNVSVLLLPECCAHSAAISPTLWCWKAFPVLHSGLNF